MKRIKIFLRLTADVPVPETLVDEEIVRLTKRVPRTAAEKAFHQWLITWRNTTKENQ